MLWPRYLGAYVDDVYLLESEIHQILGDYEVLSF